jgi:hypothetical protein
MRLDRSSERTLAYHRGEAGADLTVSAITGGFGLREAVLALQRRGGRSDYYDYYDAALIR